VSPAPRTAAAIPAYQAAATIGEMVRRTRTIVPHVLVVDDGSIDGGGRIAAEAGAVVLTHDVNHGKGTALRTAFENLFGEGEFDAVVTLDADGQHMPEEIPALLAASKGADLILGVREHFFPQMSALRRASNTMSSWAISRLAGRRVPDVQTGFRVYSRRLFLTLGFPAGRFESESAIVVRAARAGLILKTVPVRLGFADGRATSHYRVLVDSLRIARAVLRARFG
jgi:glycosyltransferase involved in cell wall biosynthesis